MYKNGKPIVLQKNKASIQIPEVRDLIYEITSVDHMGLYWNSNTKDGLVYKYDSNEQLSGSNEHDNNKYYFVNDWQKL